MIKIRKFLLSDLGQVRKIEKVSFPQPWSESYFKKLYKKHPNGFLVAESSKKVAGYILGYPKSDGTGSIKTLAVDPEYRRQGIGTKLINSALKRLKESRDREVSLHTRVKNRIANAFYKNLGFEAVEKIKKYYRNGDDAYLMKKNLGA